MSSKCVVGFLVLVTSIGVAGLSFSQTCADVHGATGCEPSPMVGQTVELTGIVYVVPGIYNTGSVYFNCGGGGAGGMNFYEIGAAVADGDEITVTGTIGAFGDEIQFSSGAEYVVNSSGNAYTAEVIGTGDLSDGTSHLGGFMQVTGLLDILNPGLTYTVDDGTGPVLVFIDNTTNVDTNALDLLHGDMVEIRGSTKCYNGVGELLPRSNDDIRLVAVPEKATNWGTLKSTYR